MARFGNSSDMGYEEDFPIKIVKCEPFIEKFADELNHRDFLGALMNLGIRRETLGDIVINGHTGYIFSTEKMADYIVDNLNKVKHTNMRNSITQELPVDAEPKLSRLNLVVSSSRADVIVAGFTKLSRSQTLELFADQKVSINGRVFENNSGNINEGDIISVRGFGKFRFKKIAYHTKKDRISIEIEKYI
jgi:RNA-binding protein YlmH